MVRNLKARLNLDRPGHSWLWEQIRQEQEETHRSQSEILVSALTVYYQKTNTLADEIVEKLLKRLPESSFSAAMPTEQNVENDLPELNQAALEFLDE